MKAFHRFHEATKPIPEADGAELSPGENVDYTVEFPIPESAPTTFHATKNDVEWQLEVTVDVPNWPDVRYHTPVVVRPPRA